MLPYPVESLPGVLLVYQVSGCVAWLVFPVSMLVLVVLLSGFHGMLAAYVRDFAADQNRHSERYYRMVNEVPTILMIGIVILAIVKPF